MLGACSRHLALVDLALGRGEPWETGGAWEPPGPSWGPYAVEWLLQLSATG